MNYLDKKVLVCKGRDVLEKLFLGTISISGEKK